MKAHAAVLGCALAGLALAGCDTPATPTVATARTSTPAAARPSISATSAETDYDKALRYTRCMTANGTPMPDPIVGQPLLTGNIFTVVGGKPIYVEQHTFEKCRQYLPATWPVKVDPGQLAKERKFDDCMRQRGIDVPQPDAHGMVAYPADPGTYQDTPAYRAAEDSCRKYYDDPANNQPENK